MIIKSINSRIFIIFSLVLLLILVLILMIISNKLENNKNAVLETAISQLESEKLEYIKTTEISNGLINEYWRDREDLVEKIEIKSIDGKLVKKTIVVDSGSKAVIFDYSSVPQKNFVMEMTDNVATQNRMLLKKSIFDDFKRTLSLETWKPDGKILLNNGNSYIKYYSINNSIKKVIYLDSKTKFPLKEQIYNKNELTIEREYKLIEKSDVSFDYDKSIKFKKIE